MKRNKFIKYLNEYNCFLTREGNRHSIFTNTANGNYATIPRHPDINDYTAETICKQLGIPKILSH
ncbi:MAG: type II toxin-antitoxin system HicA family toxin [Prevotellaceae bacterium]|jgi:predicted RNA binding protein YcfA (HicA-like mRNA interferase family)|nr:type II toxin-antitoxin system HicA family toxin [Prevotellaceae bacterium]